MPNPSKPISKTEVRREQLQRIEFFQGILPHPDLLDQYRQIDPELPKKIVQWTEDEALHRRKMERKIAFDAHNTVIWGYIFGFLSVIVISVLCYLFMVNGYADEAKWIACSVIVALAVVFVLRKIPALKKLSD